MGSVTSSLQNVPPEAWARLGGIGAGMLGAPYLQTGLSVLGGGLELSKLPEREEAAAIPPEKRTPQQRRQAAAYRPASKVLESTAADVRSSYKAGLEGQSQRSQMPSIPDLPIPRVIQSGGTGFVVPPRGAQKPMGRQAVVRPIGRFGGGSMALDDIVRLLIQGMV